MDAREAVRWYTRAAQAGHASAQSNLGYCYEHGTGVTADAREAVCWYTRAAEAGYASAQYNLGVCYQNGTGVTADAREAARLFTLAAASSDASVVATAELGLMRMQQSLARAPGAGA